MNTHAIMDLQEDHKNHIKQYGYDLIDYSYSVPGEGYGYLICLQNFPIAFLVERFQYVCNLQGPDHKIHIIYNDPDSMGRWTVQPYRYKSHSEAFYKIELIPEFVYARLLSKGFLVELPETLGDYQDLDTKLFLLNRLWMEVSTLF